MVREVRRRGGGAGATGATTEPSPGKRAATDALAPPRQQVAPSEDAGEDLDEDVGFVEGNIARFEGDADRSDEALRAAYFVGQTDLVGL
jgi:hypothetical protein